MPENHNHNNKMKVAEFRGYMTSKMETLVDGFKELNRLYHKLDEKITENHTRVMNNCNHQVNKFRKEITDAENRTNKKFGKINIKVASISASVAILIALAFLVLKHFMGD